jgi:transcription termination factor Rho
LEEKKEVQRLDFRSLSKISIEKIKELAKTQDFEIESSWRKDELVYHFYKFFVEKMSRGLTLSKGVLEILPEGYGFLRTHAAVLDDTDVYVSQSQVRRFGLRTGDEVTGQVRPPKDSESYYALIKVEEVNKEDPEVFQRKRLVFEKLVPLYPNQKIRMERKDPKHLDVRLLDLVTPIGKGQRGLIVAPPKAGKTTLLQSIANSITENHPEIELMVLLIDERPEEVTDMMRNVKGEVVASCFDEPVANHIRVTEMVLERAKRKVEMGRDVVILMDSITRLARAYNISVPSSGQTLSGGVNPHALYKPKRFFGSARKIENGGSLTILATALIDTGNKMDDFIYEEFKGTGNMELILDRELFHRRLFPSVNIKLSATRKEELLVSNEVLQRVWVLRRVLATMKPEDALEMMLKHLGRSQSNFEFLASLNKADLS